MYYTLIVSAPKNVSPYSPPVVLFFSPTATSPVGRGNTKLFILLDRHLGELQLEEVAVGSVFTITTETKFVSRDFQYRIFTAFGGYKEFWKKVGIYLKAVTGDSCKFSLENFGRKFITLQILKPCKYRKRIKLEDLANFFGIDLPLYERSEYGGELCPPPVFSGGGGCA